MKLGLAFAASALVASTAAFVPVAGYAADYVMKISSPAPLTGSTRGSRFWTQWGSSMTSTTR